jgi:hypothetical protein
MMEDSLLKLISTGGSVFLLGFQCFQEELAVCVFDWFFAGGFGAGEVQGTVGVGGVGFFPSVGPVVGAVLLILLDDDGGEHVLDFLCLLDHIDLIPVLFLF